MKFKYKEEHTVEQRKAESSKIRTKYPERIPVIVEKDPKSHIQNIDKRKFLVPSDISVAQFMWIIRKRIQLPSEKAIFLFVGKVLPQSSLLQQIDESVGADKSVVMWGWSRSVLEISTLQMQMRKIKKQVLTWVRFMRTTRMMMAFCTLHTVERTLLALSLTPTSPRITRAFFTAPQIFLEL